MNAASEPTRLNDTGRICVKWRLEDFPKVKKATQFEQDML